MGHPVLWLDERQWATRSSVGERKTMGYPPFLLANEGRWATRLSVAGHYAVILSPWLGGWLVTRMRAGLGLRFIA
jgi:hypothetical protein